MHFLLLLFLMVPCVPDRWEQVPWVGSAGLSAALTAAAMAGTVALAALVSRRVRLRLARDPEARKPVLRRYTRWRLLHAFALFGVYGVALYGFGWGWAVQSFFGQNAVPPGAELLVLAPFLAALLGSWACFYDAERALHEASARGDGFWTRGAFVVYHLRHHLALVFLPVLLLLVEKAVRHALPQAGGLLGSGVTFLGALGMFAAMPWLLRLALGLKPLPPGPLRDRLTAAAYRLNFRCNDVLVWNTRGGVANAMVAGVLPVLRYVLLTDRLVAELSPDEVEAVFGHEVGHVKHHHILYYFGFLVASMMVLSAGAVVFLDDWFGPGDGGGQVLMLLPVVGVLGTYIFVVFGFLSRRCERQADVYGCRAVSCAEAHCQGHDTPFAAAPAARGLCPTGIGIFIDALEKVATLNGISRDRPGWLQSWQHSTIARRVAFLQRVRQDRRVEANFQRRVAFVKWGLMAGLAVALTLLVWRGWDSLKREFFDAADPPAEARQAT